MTATKQTLQTNTTVIFRFVHNQTLTDKQNNLPDPNIWICFEDFPTVSENVQNPPSLDLRGKFLPPSRFPMFSFLLLLCTFQCVIPPSRTLEIHVSLPKSITFQCNYFFHQGQLLGHFSETLTVYRTAEKNVWSLCLLTWKMLCTKRFAANYQWAQVS